LAKAGEAAATGLLANTRRRKLAATPGERFPRLHAGPWGEGKTGKTHLGLAARTHEVWLAEEVDPDSPFSKLEPTSLLLASKPLVTAYANFDRPVFSVLPNLPADADITEEAYWCDEEGNPLVIPTDKERADMIEALGEFLDDSVTNGVEMFVVDGATFLWEEVREWKLSGIEPGGKDGDGVPRHLPRQYKNANEAMRGQVMRKFYGLPMHGVLTREAREVWSSQNKVATDENGEALHEAHGWNRSLHFLDVEFRMKWTPRSKGGTVVRQREAIISGSVKGSQIGMTVPDPTFAKVYGVTFGVPLLKQDDIPTFMELEAEHGKKLIWKESDD
jgi:hypothetical protein